MRLESRGKKRLMRTIFTIAGIAISLILFFYNDIGWTAYVVWFVSFILVLIGWSFFYSVVFMLFLASYNFISIESDSTFLSIVLPSIAGVLAFFIFTSLLMRYYKVLGGGNSAADYSYLSDGSDRET